MRYPGSGLLRALDRTEAHAPHGVGAGVFKGIFKTLAILTVSMLAVYLLNQTLPDATYREFGRGGARIVIWLVAQLHLMLGAFMLGAPIFAVIVEVIGWRTKEAKYDLLAWDFTKLVAVAGAITSLTGGAMLIVFAVFYPKLFSYMRGIFMPTWYLYVGLLFAEVILVEVYFLMWDRMARRKGAHILMGVLLNLVGTSIVFLTNAWAAFMMTPQGVSDAGVRESLWKVIHTYSWMPLNLHRLVANVAFGGAVASAYAAFRFLSAKTDKERAYFDWMGYIGNFIMISALIPLPFMGYYLGREIYAYSEQMGVSMMGGAFSWLWIVQAALIGALFTGLNYYLWLSMGKIEGAQRYRKAIPPLLVVLILCYAVWLTPHSLVASLEEARAIGGTHHPVLGVLGVMSAKNTAVNLMILTTYLSFLFYRRANKECTASWKSVGNGVLWSLVAGAAVYVIYLGVKGYFVPAIVRIGYSVYQVGAVACVLIFGTLLDVLLYRGAKVVGPIRWGRMPARSQYTLLFLAVSFIWLMGLMGYIRSGVRQFWHVYGVVKDTSSGAYLPAHGVSGMIVSSAVLIFFLFICLVFYLGQKIEKKVEISL
ncbi:MAG: cytochrome ubiquinol oxidase subunit I [Nitrospirae bacterium]|nr:cytochrome ubiquinol oxidase subunit I [Nitrospirota bacterium]